MDSEQGSPQRIELLSQLLSLPALQRWADGSQTQNQPDNELQLAATQLFQIATEQANSSNNDAGKQDAPQPQATAEPAKPTYRRDKRKRTTPKKNPVEMNGPCSYIAMTEAPSPRPSSSNTCVASSSDSHSGLTTPDMDAQPTVTLATPPTNALPNTANTSVVSMKDSTGDPILSQLSDYERLMSIINYDSMNVQSGDLIVPYVEGKEPEPVLPEVSKSEWLMATNDVRVHPSIHKFSRKQVFAKILCRMALFSTDKMTMSLSELLRRILGVEAFNRSAIGALLRRAKVPIGNDQLNGMLHWMGLDVPPGGHLNVSPTCFTTLPEEEGQRLVGDMVQVLTENFPFEETAESMNRNMLEQKTLQEIVHGITCMCDHLRCFIDLMEKDGSPILDRPPRKTLHAKLQTPLSIFSLITHACGTPMLLVFAKYMYRLMQIRLRVMAEEYPGLDIPGVDEPLLELGSPDLPPPRPKRRATKRPRVANKSSPKRKIAARPRIQRKRRRSDLDTAPPTQVVAPQDALQMEVARLLQSALTQAQSANVDLASSNAVQNLASQQRPPHVNVLPTQVVAQQGVPPMAGVDPFWRGLTQVLPTPVQPQLAQPSLANFTAALNMFSSLGQSNPGPNNLPLNADLAQLIRERFQNASSSSTR